MRAMLLNTTAVVIAGVGTLLPEPIETPGVGPVLAAATSDLLAQDFDPGFIRYPGSPVAVFSTSRCLTTYGVSAPPNGPSTDAYISTSRVYRTKTEILTPKPIITSISATSTSTSYTTADNNLTSKIYTSTSTFSYISTTTTYVTLTSTDTISVLSTVTVPTPDGFTAVAVAAPEASLHPNDGYDNDKWVVQDSYWQDDDDLQWTKQPSSTGGGVISLYAGAPGIGRYSPSSAGVPSKVDCVVTVLDVFDSYTTTTRSSVSPTTLTHTKIVAIETVTSTVTTRNAPTDTPITTSTVRYVDNTSYYTETRTRTVTTTKKVYPSSTTSIHAACATNNIINSYKGYSELKLAEYWEEKNFTVAKPNVDNATACCESAATHDNAIFFKWEGWCDVYLDDSSNSTALRTTDGKIDVEVLYTPREAYWYGATFGNGPCGNIFFSSYWV